MFTPMHILLFLHANLHWVYCYTLQRCHTSRYGYTAIPSHCTFTMYTACSFNLHTLLCSCAHICIVTSTALYGVLLYKHTHAHTHTHTCAYISTSICTSIFCSISLLVCFMYPTTQDSCAVDTTVGSCGVDTTVDSCGVDTTVDSCGVDTTVDSCGFGHSCRMETNADSCC